VREFEQFREVIHVILPRLRVDSGSPLLIFALKTENDMKALLPESDGQKGTVSPAGFFQAGAEKNYVILRLDVQGQQRYHVIYHEYLHSLVRLNFHYLPLWLNEGLAEFFSQASLSDKLSHLFYRPLASQNEAL